MVGEFDRRVWEGAGARPLLAPRQPRSRCTLRGRRGARYPLRSTKSVSQYCRICEAQRSAACMLLQSNKTFLQGTKRLMESPAKLEGNVDVSVIVAVRDGASTLGQCIDSVICQEGVNVELVIVDAMSTDGTEAVVQAYAPKITKYIREPDGGIYDAWNKALPYCRGEWCAFLGSDDYYLRPRAVHALLSAARNSESSPVFVYGGVLRIGGPQEYVLHPDPRSSLEFLQSGRMLPHPGSLHQTIALRECGQFDARYQISGDFAALLNLAQRGDVQRCPEVVVAMHIGGISSSWPAQRLAAREKFRALKESVGYRAAIRRHVSYRWPQIVGRTTERAVLTLLGPRRGMMLLLEVRRWAGRPPKLI